MKDIFRKRIVFIFLLAAIWEAAARSGVFPSMMFPSIGRIWWAFQQGITSGELVDNAVFSLYLIIAGLVAAVVLAIVMSVFAMISKTFSDFVDTMVAIMDPLPGIALLPLAILWFGGGTGSIIFIIVHATLWPMILNAMTGLGQYLQYTKKSVKTLACTGPSWCCK